MTRRYSSQLEEPTADAYLDDFNTGDGTPSYASRIHASVLWTEKERREERRTEIAARQAREAQEAHARESRKLSDYEI